MTTNCIYRTWDDRIKILGFTYGSQPEDWHFWFPAENDHYIGEFWRMVEEPEIYIPGAWVEEEQPPSRGAPRSYGYEGSTRGLQVSMH